MSYDYDLDGDQLSEILVYPPSNGTLFFNNNGSFTYIPESNYNMFKFIKGMIS